MKDYVTDLLYYRSEDHTVDVFIKSHKLASFLKFKKLFDVCPFEYHF